GGEQGFSQPNATHGPPPCAQGAQNGGVALSLGTDSVAGEKHRGSSHRQCQPGGQAQDGFALAKHIEQARHTLAGQDGLGDAITIDLLVQLVKLFHTPGAEEGDGELSLGGTVFMMDFPIARERYEERAVPRCVARCQDADDGIPRLVCLSWRLLETPVVTLKRVAEL